jgi:hypothetical protein
MSMNAIFVQVDDAEIARFEADPDSSETLFADLTLPSAGLLNMSAAMQERVRTMGPQAVAATFSRLPEPLRQQLEASLGRTTAAMAAGEGGDDILKLMEKQLARRSRTPTWRSGSATRRGIIPSMARRRRRPICAASRPPMRTAR